MLNYSLSRSLSTNPLPTSWCTEICARPSARHRRKKCFLRDHLGGLSRKRRKSESPRLLCYNRSNHETYENVVSVCCLSQSTAFRTGTCSPAKPTRSQALNASGITLCLCTVALGLATRCARAGHLEVTPKLIRSPSMVRTLTRNS